MGDCLILLNTWQLWNIRNSWVFEGKRLDPFLAHTRIMRLFDDFEVVKSFEATSLETQSPRTKDGVWRAPSLVRPS